jgi:O-antigen ligase
MGRQFVTGVATDKNMLGMTCLIYGLGVWWELLAIYQEKKGRERTHRLIAHGTVLLMILYIFSIADSMTSLSCFIIGSGLIGATSLFKMARKPVMLHLAVATAVGVSFGVLFLHVSAGALETMGRNATLTGRTEIWAELLRHTGNPLFGTGFDSFWLGRRLKEIWASGSLLNGINESHNGYLETYLNLGWTGLILLAVLIVTGYRNIISTLSRDPRMGGLKLAFFVAAIIYNFTEAGFRTSCSIWIAFLIAITVVPEAPILKRSRPLAIGDYVASTSDAKFCVGTTIDHRRSYP